ncbi:MAG TPA: SPFH domain-containing protein [Kofleriaceae bacterium]|nr:SPFH domain-containing protein [Kofleriaceae bacterium]
MSVKQSCALAVAVALSGCVAAVGGNERALFYSAGGGMQKSAVGPGWYWHLPWNHYEIYDIRWKEHHEQIHMHTRDGLHLDVEIAVVCRPTPDELFDLHTTVGPDFYNQLVRPALFAASRDGGGQFNHLDVATRTHEVELAIKAAIQEHLKGQHIDVAEIAVQHFDLPPEVEAAANRTAASAQLIAAKKVDLELAQKDADIIKEQRRGAIEAEGLERQLRAEQELAAAEQQLKIEEAKRKSQLEKEQTDAEILTTQAEAEAKAVKIRAEAEDKRILAESAHLTPNYVRLAAVKTLADALAQAKMVIVPVGTNGLPSFFGPFLNPLSGALDTGK